MEIMRPLPGVHSSKWSRIQLKIEEHRCYNHATISMFISMILVFICCCCSARSLVLAHSDAGSEAWTCVVVGARSCTELNVEKICSNDCLYTAQNAQRSIILLWWWVQGEEPAWPLQCATATMRWVSSLSRHRPACGDEIRKLKWGDPEAIVTYRD